MVSLQARPSTVNIHKCSRELVFTFISPIRNYTNIYLGYAKYRTSLTRRMTKIRSAVPLQTVLIERHPIFFHWCRLYSRAADLQIIFRRWTSVSSWTAPSTAVCERCELLQKVELTDFCHQINAAVNVNLCWTETPRFNTSPEIMTAFRPQEVKMSIILN